MNARLDAMLTQEKGLTVGPEIKHWSAKFSLFSSSSKNRLTYRIANTKEIEKEIIGIFNDIEAYRNMKTARRPTLSQRFFRVLHVVPEFVFVLDELDKIEPDFVTEPQPGNTNPHAATVSHNVQRREAVARLLASLKSFLNEAKAKFIFVGGREMYDASLADIADRESFYGSIFHDVIYVSSFFKDKIQQRSGVTRLTEAYLCQMLIPLWYKEKYVEAHERQSREGTHPDEWFNLGTFYHFLADCHWQHTGTGHAMYRYHRASFHDAPPNASAAAHKIIYLLQNFIIYLAYRSNGTPKKLAGLLEHYLVPGHPHRTPGHKTKGSFLCDLTFKPSQGWFAHDIVLFQPLKTGERQPQEHGVTGKIFLKFNFNQQYEIGLTSNLYRPYVIIHSRYLKSLGDKMLHATSYVMDYILKFHPHGFSWRNLEMIPDIILTNKDPNLRAFMQDLMQFLSRMHVRETVNGMFQFKFFVKIVNEIKFLSKISEQGSAAFNFTLDESQQIKHYYRDKLQKLQSQNHEPGTAQSAREESFLFSVAFLQGMLGDMHFYDGEYDDAIIYYSDASQRLRDRIQKSSRLGVLTYHQVVLLFRTQLKLSMSLEKVRNFDHAYAIYRSLISDAPHLLQPKAWDEEDNPAARADSTLGDKPLRRMQLFIRPYIAILDVIEKQRLDGVTFANLRRNFIDLSNLLEKGGECPILLPAQSEGQEAGTHDQKRLNTLYADYFNNVGSILFFKNLNFGELYANACRTFPELGEQRTIFDFLKKHRGQSSSDYNPTLSAFIYYRHAVGTLTKSFQKDLATLFQGQQGGYAEYIKEGGVSDLAWAALLLCPEASCLANGMQMYVMGNLFSKIGDAVLACAGPNAPGLDQKTIDIYKENDVRPNEKEEGCLLDCLVFIRRREFPFDDPLNSALVLYRLSGFFFLKANRSFSYAFQLKKFLFVVKDWLSINRKTLRKDAAFQVLLTNLEPLLCTSNAGGTPSLAQRLLHSIAWSADVSNRPQITKYREIFEDEYDKNHTASIYNNISTGPETREVVLLIEETRLKIAAIMEPSYIQIRLDRVLTPYDTISSKYVRILEMKYKCEYNYVMASRLKCCSGKAIGQILLKEDYQGKEGQTHLSEILKSIDVPALEAFEGYVLDSIFCLYEVTRALNVYGTTYVTNHSFVASAHERLADWCRAFNNLAFGYAGQEGRGGTRADDIRHALTKILGTDVHYTLKPNYHSEQAIEHYYMAMQTHAGGRAYRNNVTKMSFLEDDFNDNLTHFSAASERFRINAGSVREKINILKASVKGSKLFDYESYH